MLRVVALVLTLSVSLAHAKSEEETHYLTHEFENGNSVIFRTGAKGVHGTFFQRSDGKAILIDPAHPYFIGQPEGARDSLVNLQGGGLNRKYWKTLGTKKFAYAIVGGHLLIVDPNGNHRRITLVPGGSPSYHEMKIPDSYVYDLDGKEHLVFTYGVNSVPSPVAVIVNEDLNAFTKSIAPEQAGNVSALVQDLKAAMPPLADPAWSVESLYREASLAKAYLKRDKAGEPEWVSPEKARGETPEYRQLIDVQVLDNAGNQVSAIALLAQFSTNLTDKFKKNPIPAAHVNQRKIEEISEVLAGYEITSVAYLGFPGTGKTTDINMMISEAANGRGPEFLHEYTFIKLEPTGMDSQKWKGSTQTNINAIRALARANKIIFVMDEVHRMKGLGTHQDKPHDVTEDFKDDMAEGVLKLIGMSTDTEYYDAGFSRPFLDRMVVVAKDEPQGDELLRMLRGWIVSRDLPDPGEAFLREARDIADRFASVGAQPRKTTKLLDAIYARLKVSGRAGQTPDIAFLHEVARARLGFDPALIDTQLGRQRFEKMSKTVDSRIIGQAEARALFDRATMRALTGMVEPNQPRLKMLLTGVEGQGKTSIAKAYADGMGVPYRVIDMSQCNAPVGSGPLAQAAQALAINAFTVLIFDELEKCPVELQVQLLQAIENGRTLVHMKTKAGVVGEMVDFRNASVIFTANAGADEIRRRGKSPGFFNFTKQSDREMLNSGGAISRYILDRVPDIAIIEALNREEFRAAVELHVNALLKALATIGVNVRFVDQELFLDFAASLWKENMSNRRITNILQPIRDYLAQEKLLTEGFRTDDLELSFDGTNLKLSGTAAVYSCEGLLQ